ncbi:acyl-CoA thioesterase/bile acid-CoA:amino acid N-acyltransferase family protein [Xanthomonas sp. BRIP62409]|uniref:acyl-CoA thioesterase/bile acid-CoA:amino acid N-acyltransferase family protein n=1 Tax=Xanthomonas sp. BRIP62409 TaxID=2182388 RepID=UPI000F8D130E|nr:acyl-CoA thioesterase/bile acid-CoA:amino acid N-acyltransferase family protein [Xanthomonas sp. BRIP62409]
MSFPDFSVMHRLAIALVALLGCNTASAADLRVWSLDSGADAPLGVHVSGMQPTELVELRLSMRDAKGNLWRSSALYRADLDGRVDPSSTASEAGTYVGVDEAGLFWSMRPEGPSRPSPFPIRRRDADLRFAPAQFTVEMVLAGRVVDSVEMRRWIDGEGVSAFAVHSPGLVANVYAPRSALVDGRRHPAVITLGGSEGGIDSADMYAAWLASHGFVAMSVGYYRLPGLPKDLVRVPIDPVSVAVDWLQKQRYVDASGIGVLGGSWGGTIAMAAASHDQRLHAVVSLVGSPAPFRGIQRDVEPADFRAVDKPGLTLAGKDLPFLPYRAGASWLDDTDLQAQAALKAAMLPLERINGPLMLVAAGDDQLGLSGQMAAVAKRYLAQHARKQPDQILYFSDAGHLISPLWQPTTYRHELGPHLQVGGSPQGYARADRESGAAVIRFLRAALER